MVNLGSFTPLRKQFLADQQHLYAQAVAKNHVGDTIADIQRRYFKRFPLTLPHNEEPTQEWLSQVDDEVPEEEIKPPSKEGLDDQAYASAFAEYEATILQVKYRKDQIRRRLQYQYSKSKAPSSKSELSPSNPMAVLVAQISGSSLKKPRLRTGYNIWGPQNRAVTDPIFAKRVKDNSVPVKKQAALRCQAYKECFKELPADERQIWEDRAKAEHQAALREIQENVTGKKEPSTRPEDRQRAIHNLPSFAQPLLNIIASHTGWKVTLIAGGPEPADQGRLNMISVHSGETKGSVKMNFGKSERRAYKEFVIPVFGNFLKKCYTVEECRASALSDSYASLVKTLAEQDEGSVTLDSAEECRVIKVAALPKSRSVSSESSAEELAGNALVPPRSASSRTALDTQTVLLVSGPSIRVDTSPKSLTPQIHSHEELSMGQDVSTATIPSLVLTVEAQRERSPPFLPPFLPPFSPPVTPTASPKQIPSPLDGEMMAVEASNSLEVTVELNKSASPQNKSDISALSDGSLVRARCEDAQDEIEVLHVRKKLRCSLTPTSVTPGTTTVSFESNCDAQMSDTRLDVLTSLAIGACPQDIQVNTDHPTTVVPPPLDLEVNTSVGIPANTQGQEPANLEHHPPKWFSDAMLLYRSQPMCTEWDALILSWSKFQEEASNYSDTGKLGSSCRPSCIGSWIKHARSATFNPDISNLRQFKQQFLAWWSGLQPEWRLDPRTGIIKQPSVKGDMEVFRKPSKNGVYNLIQALWFWGLAAKGKKGIGGENAWKAAINDVLWVMDRLTST